MFDSFTSVLTGGLINPGSGDFSKKATKQEKKRQQVLDYGTDLIDAIFYGGTTPLYTPVTDKFTKSAWQQYKANPQPLFSLTPKGINPFVKSRAAVNKQIQRGNLFTGSEQTFEGFQPTFFDQRAKDYINFAMPQLEKQFRDNFEAIMYNMANRGLLGGSASQKAQSDLFTAAGQGRQRIADEAISQAQQLRQDVERARQSAIDLLYQTSNPAQAMQRAVAMASEFRQPSTFAPIANMFANLANQYYMNQVLNTYRNGVAPLALDYSQNPTVALNIPRNN